LVYSPDGPLTINPCPSRTACSKVAQAKAVALILFAFLLAGCAASSQDALTDPVRNAFHAERLTLHEVLDTRTMNLGTIGHMTEVPTGASKFERAGIVAQRRYLLKVYERRVSHPLVWFTASLKPFGEVQIFIWQHERDAIAQKDHFDANGNQGRGPGGLKRARNVVVLVPPVLDAHSLERVDNALRRLSSH
jgi:hypothetical protein